MAALIVIIIAAIFAIIFLTSRKSDSQSQLPSSFDLLDDNGNPLKSEPVVEELKYFCTKDSGYYVSVWPKNQKTGDYLEFEIAGMSYRENIDDYLGEFKGTLEAEPINEYDPNAIKVLAADGHHVGYVPKDMTKEVRDNAQLPCPCFCYVGSNDGKYYTDCYVIRKANQCFPTSKHERSANLYKHRQLHIFPCNPNGVTNGKRWMLL